MYETEVEGDDDEDDQEMHGSSVGEDVSVSPHSIYAILTWSRSSHRMGTTRPFQ